jgi:hypothetical protein
MVWIPSSNHQRPWFNHDAYYYSLCLDLLGANCNLRDEVLDVLFCEVVVKFGYALSAKKNLCFTSEPLSNDKDSYFTQWPIQYELVSHASHGLLELTQIRPRMERIYATTSTFEFIRRIRLGKLRQGTCHRMQSGMHSVHSHTPNLVEPIRFITEHCLLLESLHFEARNVLHRQDSAVSELEMLKPVLKYLVLRRSGLTVLGVVSSVQVVYTDQAGSIADIRHGQHDQDFNLNLGGVPIYARDDLVEIRCSSALREAFEYDNIVQLISGGPLNACERELIEVQKWVRWR